MKPVSSRATAVTALFGCFLAWRCQNQRAGPGGDEGILDHVGEPPVPPAVLAARAPPQAVTEFDQTVGLDEWPEMDQTSGSSAPKDDAWH